MDREFRDLLGGLPVIWEIVTPEDEESEQPAPDDESDEHSS